MMIYPNREMKKSIKEQIEEVLFEDIVCGVYPPGTVLNEGTLTKKFGVSKSPVREALVTLCRDGVLMNIPRCGYQVVPITPHQFLDMQELRVIVEESARCAKPCAASRPSRWQRWRKMCARVTAWPKKRMLYAIGATI